MNAKTFVPALIGIALAIGLWIANRPRSRTTAQSTTAPDPNLFMPETAAKAVSFAASRGVALDYSPASVKSVEMLLGQLHDDRVKGALTDQEVNSHALHFGGYIGEVLRRKYGGTWATDHPMGGPQSYPINWNGIDSFPVGWCGKRILNGDEDNVWFKFQVFISKSYQSGGMTTLPVKLPASGLKQAPPTAKN